MSKTGVNGLLLTEAKYINLSLHYLEQVLSDKFMSLLPTFYSFASHCGFWCLAANLSVILAWGFCDSVASGHL